MRDTAEKIVYIVGMNNSIAVLALPQPALPGEMVPFALQTVTLTKQAYIELTSNANRWKTQRDKSSIQIAHLKKEIAGLNWQIRCWQVKHTEQVLLLKKTQEQLSMALAREEAQKEKLKAKTAMILDLRRRLFGKKTEKKLPKLHESNPDMPALKSSRPRGQQIGSKGHGRTQRPDLPLVEEIISLKADACPQCGEQYSPLPAEESNIFEVEVRAHTRRIKREQAIKHCDCQGPKVVTADLPLKLIPRSPYGVSVWEQVLIGKFLYAQPVNRLLKDLGHLGLIIAPGTIAGGLQKLAPLFLPVYQGFYAQQMTENKFHNDETRWEVYQQIEGKVGHRWYLWLTRSSSVVYYCIDPTRSAAVPIKHFSNLLSKSVIVICDRYGAYKKLARLNLAIIIAFCWAHVRRDFLNLVRGHPTLIRWGLDWVNDIGTLYHLNNERLKVWDPLLPLTQQSVLFQERHQALGIALDNMKTRLKTLLQANKVAESKKDQLEKGQRTVLVSLKKHWKGLRIFYDHPEVSMDNNSAEESMRNPVLGRNGYYGSGSIWSAELAAMMFSLFQTLLLWRLNPRTWLRLYLNACLQNGGKPPQDLSAFFPWTMTRERLKQLSVPP